MNKEKEQLKEKCEKQEKIIELMCRYMVRNLADGDRMNIFGELYENDKTICMANEEEIEKYFEMQYEKKYKK